jgi:hypothetical protein
MSLWYLDNAASGENDGTSWTDAWESPGNIVWGGAGIVAGDTLYISGGAISKTYTATANNEFEIGASGSDGSPITIATGAKSPSPSGHAGEVIFDGDGTYSGLIYADGKNYITIDGEKSGARNWTFQNPIVGDETSPVVIAFGTNDIITYLTITTSFVGVYATGADEIEISYCSITDVRWQAAIRTITGNGGATEYGLSKIHHNTIQTNYNSEDGAGPDGIQCGTSTDIYNNIFYTAAGTQVGGQHPDMVQSAGPYLRIYNNTFRNPIDSVIDIDRDGWGVDLQHFWVYNNVFVIDSDNGVPTPGYPTGIRYYNSVGGSTIEDVVIANNSFVDYNYAGLTPNCINIELNGDEAVSDVIIENNLFYNASADGYYLARITASSGAVAADWNVDYNLTNAGANGVTVFTVDGAAHTQIHPRTNAPVFAYYSLYDPDNDLHLAFEDTAARGQGTNLSVYFTTDKDGITRSAWDLGAYEYEYPTSMDFNQSIKLRF